MTLLRQRQNFIEHNNFWNKFWRCNEIIQRFEKKRWFQIFRKSLFAHFFLLFAIFSLKLKFSKNENKIFEYQKIEKKITFECVSYQNFIMYSLRKRLFEFEIVIWICQDFYIRFIRFATYDFKCSILNDSTSYHDCTCYRIEFNVNRSIALISL